MESQTYLSLGLIGKSMLVSCWSHFGFRGGGLLVILGLPGGPSGQFAKVTKQLVHNPPTKHPYLWTWETPEKVTLKSQCHPILSFFCQPPTFLLGVPLVVSGRHKYGVPGRNKYGGDRRKKFSVCPKFKGRVFLRLLKRRRHADWAHQAHKHIRHVCKHIKMHTNQSIYN